HVCLPPTRMRKVYFMVTLFFFSSRRRHTRSKRDWSSDVCSSDLTTAGQIAHLRGTPTPDGRHRAIVDLTDPEARAWWQRLHHPFLDDGTAVFKTDFGEGLPEDRKSVV